MNFIQQLQNQISLFTSLQNDVKKTKIDTFVQKIQVTIRDFYCIRKHIHMIPKSCEPSTSINIIHLTLFVCGMLIGMLVTFLLFLVFLYWYR